MASNWYSVNRYLDYPLISSATAGLIDGLWLGKTCLLDASFQLYSPETLTADAAVWVSEVAISSGTLTISVSIGDIPSAFVFTTSKESDAGIPIFVDTAYGLAYLVVGKWQHLSDGTYTQSAPANTQFEPATVQVLAGYGVKNLVVYSQPAHTDYLEDLVPLWVGEITDTVKFVPGYNLQPAISFNSISLLPSLGAGLGVAREETTDSDSSLPLDDFTCCNVLYTFNGIAPDDSGNFVINTFNTLTVVQGVDENPAGMTFHLDPQQLLVNCPPGGDYSSLDDSGGSSTSPTVPPSSLDVHATLDFSGDCLGCTTLGVSVQMQQVVDPGTGHIYLEGDTGLQVTCGANTLVLRFRLAPSIPGRYDGWWYLWASRSTPVSQDDTTYTFSELALLGKCDSGRGQWIGNYGDMTVGGSPSGVCGAITYSSVYTS